MNNACIKYEKFRVNGFFMVWSAMIVLCLAILSIVCAKCNTRMNMKNHAKKSDIALGSIAR